MVWFDVKWWLSLSSSAFSPLIFVWGRFLWRDFLSSGHWLTWFEETFTNDPVLSRRQRTSILRQKSNRACAASQISEIRYALRFPIRPSFEISLEILNFKFSIHFPLWPDPFWPLSRRWKHPSYHYFRKSDDGIAVGPASLLESEFQISDLPSLSLTLLVPVNKIDHLLRNFQESHSDNKWCRRPCHSLFLFSDHFGNFPAGASAVTIFFCRLIAP